MVPSVRFVLLAKFLLASGLLACGCSGNHTPPPPTDPAQARLALTAALDAWKSGAELKSLAQAKPPVYVGDENWSRGDKLNDYQITAEGEPFGGSVRFSAVLEFSSYVRKPARYLVATNPVVSIMRDDSEE